MNKMRMVNKRNRKITRCMDCPFYYRGMGDYSCDHPANEGLWLGDNRRVQPVAWGPPPKKCPLRKKKFIATYEVE